MIKKILFLILFSAFNTKLLWTEFEEDRFLGEWYQVAHGEDHPFVDDDATDVKMIFRKLQSNNLELKTEYFFKGSVDSYLRTAKKEESEEEVTYELEGKEEKTWYSWINRYNKEHFRVLDTDYDNWALLLFNRSRYFVNKDSWGIILSR